MARRSGAHGEAAARDGRSERLRAALDQRGEVTAEDVARAASFGDPVAVALLQAAGRRIGAMLACVVNFFNPSLIVIGGGVAHSPDQLLAAIRETVYRRSLPLATRELLVQRSSLGGLAGVIGASSMVVDQLFARDSIARWIAAGEPSGAPEVALARAKLTVVSQGERRPATNASDSVAKASHSSSSADSRASHSVMSRP